MNRPLYSFLLLFIACLAAGLYGGTAYAEGVVAWRIRFLEAAIVQGPVVVLGEVAVPVGEMPPETWQTMAGRELWPSPPEKSGAVNMTRPKLQEAVAKTMGDLAPYCLFPGSMALQRGGAVLGKDEIQATVVKSLTPHLSQVPGEPVLRDFRLPGAIFLSHKGQTLTLDPPHRLEPGRVSLRLHVVELDGKVVQRLSGTLLLDAWVQAPSAATPLNKDDILEPDSITFIRTNLANLRGALWDGKSGPWRVVRPIGMEQVIYQSDLAHIPTIRKGSQLTLVYEGKTLRLVTRAEALADGVAGQQILLRNLQSKKEVYGTVRDASTVVVTGH